MDNNQMRAVYNSFGTLNRPQNFGDDLYNDKENLAPASPDLTQTGTDEAGNPIMAPVETPEIENKPIMDNIIEYTSNAGPTTGLPGPIAAIGDTVVSYIAGNDEQRQQVVDRMKRFTPQGIEQGLKDVIHSMSNATELEHTKLYENYFYNAEKKNAEIKRIANLLQIDENTFAHNRELYQKAALAADRVERMGKFKKYQDADGNIDMARIYADVPGLLEVQQKHGTAAAALALGNIDGVQSINDVYDNAFSRFAGSVYAGARRGWIADRRSAIWNTARKENRLPTAEEQAQLDEYAAELNTLPRYNYNTVGNVVGAMVGGAAENMAMIVKSQGAGFAARLAAGRIGGAKAGEIASNVVSTYVMAQDIAGNQYEELVNKTDAQGRPMYTPEQASWLALSQGIGEAMLEQYSLNQMGKAIFGRSAAKSITEIIKNSPTLEAAKAGVRDYAALKLREAGKAGLISLGAEAFEEFTQSASDMLMENMAQIMLRGNDADLASVEDILTKSTGQMVEALPAIGGFGLIGFGANPIANTRAVLGFRSSVRNVVNNKVLIGRMANAHYNEVLDGVWKNKGNIKELQDKAPEAVTTILDEQNRRAGMEDGFVDVRALAEENAELVNQIAEANDISKEELAACLDGSGMLQVKTSTLMQLDLKDEQHKKLMDNVTTSLDAFTLAQENSAIKLVKEQMDSLQNYNDKTYKQAVDNIIAARFPDAEQARLAREIIEANYDNPQEEFKRQLNAINAEMDEYIAPVLKELKSGMKQGVDIIRMEGDRDAKYVKQSNNADWYRNYYADYGRAPNAEELRGLAINIASGRQDNRYGLMDYQNNTEETRAYFAPVAETLDRLEEERNALLAIQDRMRNLNPGEMVATASLSPEGLKVYDTMIRMMGESENKDVQKSGRFNALFLARYADNMAKVFSRVQNRPYTAEDFVRDRFRIDVNANYNEDDMAPQLFQVSPEEFYRQKAEVRKQYEGTDQWMKAPGGEETNLTEDQWITVRTPAFKNWFGDWENDPQNASKVVDENGEPLVVYHGTPYGGFEEFRKDRQAYFTPMEWYADKYQTPNASAIRDRYDGATQPQTYPVFLNIRNPFDTRNSTERKIWDEEYYRKWGTGAPLSDKGLPDWTDGLDLQEFFEENDYDYDGLILDEGGYPDGEGGVVSRGISYVTFKPNQIKDASGRNVGFDPQSGNIYLQMAGSGAVGADLPALNKAMKMYDEGYLSKYSMKDIYDATGWLRGEDGRWRFEIPDTLDMIHTDRLRIPATENMAEEHSLPDIYDNPKLYEAYPFLRKVKVLLLPPNHKALKGKNYNAAGYADYKNLEIGMSAKIVENYLKNNNDYFIKKILLHETQHMIQEKEGFASGGNPGSVVDEVNKRIFEIEHEIEQYHPEAVEYYLLIKADNNMWSLPADEVNDQDVIAMAKAQEEFDKKTTLTEEQQAEIRVRAGEVSRLLDALKETKGNDVALYKRLAGEQEANNAAWRAKILQEAKDNGNYNEALRSAPNPHESDAVVIFSDGRTFKPERRPFPEYQQQTLFQAAYHGTPNRFERFDMEHIGDGEGAQVHGWGLYFAKDRGVAENYRNRLTDNDYKVTFTGKVLKSKQQLIDAAITEIRWGLNEGLSVEEAIQKRIDYYRDQLKFFEDHPKQATKSKVKNAEDKIKFFSDNKNNFKAEAQGQVFKVDIPENDVLLDEQKTFEEQPEKVKAGIQKLLDDYVNQSRYEKVGDEYVVYDGDREIDRYDDEEDAATAVRENNEARANSLEARGLSGEELKNAKGRAIYMRLSGLFLEDDVTSKKLNDYGIQGITYDGAQDGRSYVVFDDNAIKVIEKYYQQGKTAKGAISLTEQGQKIISLFESADQSTFIHEMAHMFLMDLQEIAGIDANSPQAKDLQTIMAWAQYKPGQVDEYKGTASAAEFRKRDADIKVAEEAGDTAKAQQLKDAWAQERFARGFEEYLRSGEAPAQGLKRAFRAFKKWLVQIYNDVLGAGVRATPEVEAIMARMVASEDEIDALAAANSIERLKKVDPDILSEDSQEMLLRWQEEAKEKAKEKLLKELMKQYEENNLKDLDQKLEAFRENARNELQNTPCFVCEQLLKEGVSKDAAFEITGFTDEDEYNVARMMAGGSLETALDNMVARAKENMLTAMPSKEQLYSMAEEALLSGDYNTRLAEMEAQLLKQREARFNNIPARLRNAFADVDEAITAFETARVKEAVQKLKYAERWDAKNFETIKELETYLAKMERQEEDREKLIKAFNKRYDELKKKTLQNQQWLRGVRDATLGHMRVIQSAAAFRLAVESVSVATNARYWHRQALSEAKRAWDNITGAQRTGNVENYNAAVRAKQQQAVYDAMTAQAIKNRKQVDRWLNGSRDGFKARAKRLADPKKKANADMRYFHNHLMYIFGLRNSDAVPPVNYKPFTELLTELRASHQFEDDVPSWLIAAADSNEPGKNYQQLTMGELEELYKLTRVLYRLAVNDAGLLTMDVDMDTIVADCTEAWLNHTDYEVGNQRINEVKGAIGAYMNGLLKPEVILSLLGGENGPFVNYIYKILFNAAEAEEIAREAEAKAQKELYSRYYTKQELRAMVNDPVRIEMPDGQKVKLAIGEDTDITKENLICMALNWGNEANRARLIVGLFPESFVKGMTDAQKEQNLINRTAEVMDILQAQLTEKDWQFVQAMWDHISTFAEPVSQVMEKSVGVPLDRVKAQAFDVELPDGKILNMAGGYYPIVKDSTKSTRQGEFDMLEEAKAIGGVSVFGTGMSATKERSDNRFLNQGPLKLTLDVANNHITAQIHLINAKMAVRDAYKVINNKQIQDMVRRTCGEETVKTMNEWVLNCWAPPIRPRSLYERFAASLRSKTVGAIMGYRVSTALLNAANVVYMAQEIGTKNTLAAIADFYRHPFENRRAILDVSIFMRNRATNMDRDLNAQNEQILKRHTAIGNAIDKATGGRSEDMRYAMEKYANWLIEQTDMMVSMPLYKWQFEQTYSEQIAKGVPEEEAREAANYEATRRVTKVFPSSRALDLSAVQRSRDEMVKLITPFFSFANTMMNAVWSKYYAGKFSGSERILKLDDNGNPVLDADGEPEYTTIKKGFVKRYSRFARAIMFNFVLGALVETLIRQVPDALAGTGDDDEDKLMRDIRKNILGNAMAGFPGINEGVNFVYESFFEKPSPMGGRGIGVLSGTAERYKKVITDLAKLTQGKDSIDALDLFRDVARAANTRTGISDTLTDAIFNTARFIGDDYQLDNMDDLREYIAKTIFDRKLKKK